MFLLVPLVSAVKCAYVFLLQMFALVQDDLEKALEKEMDKMQSTTQAENAQVTNLNVFLAE